MKAKALGVVALVVVSSLSIAIVFLWTGERVSIDAEQSDLSAVTEEARSDEGVASAGATDALSGAIVADQARDVAASVSGEEQQQVAQEALSELAPSLTQTLQDDLDLLPPIPEFERTVRDFASQLDDAPWSESTESYIFGQMSQATGLGASDIQVDCRSTLCRVRISNPVSTLNPRYRSLNELVDTFGLETLSLWAGPDGNGNPVNLIYLRRRGPTTPQSEAR
jgi:hypothetical protein